MADPRQETLKQIQEAWDAAQAQLTELRDQVEKTAALAQAKVASNFLERDLDRAYKDLGEAVWAQVSKGRLQLPKELGAVLKALENVTKKIQEQNASINDLLSEGAEVASRLKGKLATTAKKR
jgi:predicted  nucleic acid-binding Zn-ribbon protein